MVHSSMLLYFGSVGSANLPVKPAFQGEICHQPFATAPGATASRFGLGIWLGCAGRVALKTRWDCVRSFFGDGEGK